MTTLFRKKTKILVYRFYQRNVCNTFFIYCHNDFWAPSGLLRKKLILFTKKLHTLTWFQQVTVTGYCAKGVGKRKSWIFSQFYTQSKGGLVSWKIMAQSRGFDFDSTAIIIIIIMIFPFITKFLPRVRAWKSIFVSPRACKLRMICKMYARPRHPTNLLHVIFWQGLEISGFIWLFKYCQKFQINLDLASNHKPL